MSSEPQADLVTRISQLEQQQVQLKKYIATLKRRLDESCQEFNTRPELQQLAELQKRLDKLCENRVNISSSPETEVSSVEMIPTIPLLETEVIVSSSESQLVFDRLGSRSVLLEALEIAEERIIIVCPWLNCNSIDEHLLQKFRFCLSRNCKIEIGWGYLGDRNKIGKGWRYNALSDLQQLEQDYPDLFYLKLLGTHEKYIVCDDKFAMVGSHNVLTSGVHSTEREVGIRTTDLQIIQGLIHRFDQSQETEKSEIVQQFLGSIQRLDEAEYLEGVVETEDIEEDEEDEEDVEESQEPPVTAEEFLRRYNEGEQDFTGINLAGVDLSGQTLNGSNVNLSGANLKGANLSNINLYGVNLSKANLKRAKLTSANLTSTNLEQAKLIMSDLRFANFTSANLTKVQLSNTDISQVKISKETNLTEANLSQSNLNGLNLRQVKLMQANLSNADLSNTNLLWTNLEGAKLNGVKLQKAIYNAQTIFPQGFEPVKAGAYLIASGVSLKNISLVNIDLSGVNLSEADLSGANLSFSNLKNADLRDANLSTAKLTGASMDSINLSRANLNKADLKEASLHSANLIATNLREADLRQVNLVSAKLLGAELNSVDLRASELLSADLSGADLTNARLGGVNFREKENSHYSTKLQGATMPDGTVHE